MTRRTAIGTAMLAASWRRVLGANERLNIGVIGLGGRGTHLLNLVMNHRAGKQRPRGRRPGGGLSERLNQAASIAQGAKTYVHHEELLARPDIDAVFIATPDHWHAPITLEALSRGKDVYVEKPMTHTVEEAAQVARKARESKRIVQVGVQGTSWTRWHKIRDLVHSGELGQVVACQGTYSRNDPSGDWNWPIDPDAGPNGYG